MVFLVEKMKIRSKNSTLWLKLNKKLKRLVENIRILQHIFGEKIELKVYVNQHDFVSDIHKLHHASTVLYNVDLIKSFFKNIQTLR
jgi:hypothetical protein